MSHFEFVEHKTSELKRFYMSSTEPFREIKRKIEKNEDPFVPVYDGQEPSGDPPFLDEWQEANDFLRLQEQVCLVLFQRTFREFLDDTIKEHTGTKPSSKGNWFAHYCDWFKSEFDIDWSQSSANLGRLEELTEARNCVQHGGESFQLPNQYVFDSDGLIKRQSFTYHGRFPNAVFIDEYQRKIWQPPGRSEP